MKNNEVAQNELKNYTSDIVLSLSQMTEDPEIEFDKLLEFMENIFAIFSQVIAE